MTEIFGQQLSNLEQFGALLPEFATSLQAVLAEIRCLVALRPTVVIASAVSWA